MGNKRMIDGDIALSRSLNAVSRDAELTFILLTTAADSWGRLIDEPHGLMAGTYAFRPEVSVEDLIGEIDELVREECLHRYEIAGRTYLHFPNWDHYQRLRQDASERIPAPDGHCGQCAATCGNLRQPAADLPQPAADLRKPAATCRNLRPEVEVEVEVEKEVEVEVTPPASHSSLSLFATDASIVPDSESLDAMADRLLRLLTKHPGEPAVKTVWLLANLPLMICEVAALSGIETRQQANAKLCSLVIRYYRSEFNGKQHAPESFDEAHIREGREWLRSL